MRKHPHELSDETLELFEKLVPTAVSRKKAVYELPVAGRPGVVRVKRAEGLANQVHVLRGEPIVLHVPRPEGDRWHVVPVSWQLRYAGAHAKEAAHHASHAFDCMKFYSDVLGTQFLTPKEQLTLACEKAILLARNRVVKLMLKATARARDAVTNALIETLREELDLDENSDE